MEGVRGWRKQEENDNISVIILLCCPVSICHLTKIYCWKLSDLLLNVNQLNAPCILLD